MKDVDSSPDKITRTGILKRIQKLVIGESVSENTSSACSYTPSYYQEGCWYQVVCGGVRSIMQFTDGRFRESFNGVFFDLQELDWVSKQPLTEAPWPR